MSTAPMILRDRRATRSEEAYLAITLQLEHVLRLHGLRNFTLSASNGLVLARAGHMEESEVLAAYAPVLARCLDRSRRSQVVAELGEAIPEISQDEDVSVRSFFIDGERFYLGLVGRAGTKLDASMYRALTGIRRIFKQSNTAA